FFGSHLIPPSRRPTASLNPYSSSHLNSEHRSEFYARRSATRLIAIPHRIRGAGAGLALDNEAHARRRERIDIRQPSSRSTRLRTAHCCGVGATRSAL